MPHFVVEYTDNLGAEARIGELLTRVNQVLLDQGGVFPAGGIRSRAVRLTEYAVADEAEDYAFVHAVLRIGSGRSAESHAGWSGCAWWPPMSEVPPRGPGRTIDAAARH